MEKFKLTLKLIILHKMKHTNFLISALAFFLFPTVLKAQINFTELLPDTTIVHSKVSGSTIYYAIDMNDDSLMDYRIGIKFHQSFESPHHAFDNFAVFIISKGGNCMNVGPYLTNDTIMQDDFFCKSGLLFTQDVYWGETGSWPYHLKNRDEFAFVGTRMLCDGEYHYGWIKLKTDGYSFTVDSYAYNNTPDQFIKAGQKN